MPFAAVPHLDEGLILETLLTLRLEMSVPNMLCVYTGTNGITEQLLALFLKTSTRNKA
jgi:hypothetical protein